MCVYVCGGGGGGGGGEGRVSGVGGTCIELEDSKMMAVFLSLPALFPQPGSGFLAVFS